jgi:hypothetical protein
VVFAIVAILTFKLSYLVLVLIALSLNSANLAGYTKCEKEAKKKNQVVTGSNVVSGLFDNAMGGFMSKALTSRLGF